MPYLLRLLRSACRSSLLLAVFVAGVCAVPACKGTNERASHRSSRAAEVEQYLPGPWWRADISHVVAGVSHILIRHEGSAASDGALVVPGEPVARSKDEALKAALILAKSLGADASQFEAVARKHSEDEATRLFGGRIGNVHVMQLPPPMVDAIGNLEVGKISRVFETTLGYHIVKRMPVLPREDVAGREIQVHYETTLEVTARGRTRARTRAEAKAIALRAWTKAQANPETFPSLVAEFSDGLSRINQGAIGDWSTLEPFEEAPDTVAIAVLSELPVGGLSLLFEDANGFRFLQRTPVDGRRFAYSTFMVGYATDMAKNPAVTRTRDEALEIAKGALETLRVSPARFDELRAMHCDFGFCSVEPRARPLYRFSLDTLDQQLLQRPVGAILEQPVELPYGFLVVRREDEHRFEPVLAALAFELPQPPPENIETATGAQLQWFGKRFKERVMRETQITPLDRARLADEIDETFEALITAEVPERAQVLAQLYQTLEADFGPRIADKLRHMQDQAAMELQGFAN